MIAQGSQIFFISPGQTPCECGGSVTSQGRGVAVDNCGGSGAGSTLGAVRPGASLPLRLCFDLRAASAPAGVAVSCVRVSVWGIIGLMPLFLLVTNTCSLSPIYSFFYQQSSNKRTNVRWITWGVPRRGPLSPLVSHFTHDCHFQVTLKRP